MRRTHHWRRLFQHIPSHPIATCRCCCGVASCGRSDFLGMVARRRSVPSLYSARRGVDSVAGSLAPTPGTQRFLNRCIFCSRTRAHKSPNDRAPRTRVLFYPLAATIILACAALSSRDRCSGICRWTLALRVCAMGGGASSYPQLGQRLFVSRSFSSHRAQKLRIQTGDHSWLYWWATLGSTGGALCIFRASHRSAHYIRSNSGLSARPLVFLVQPGRFYFYRSIFYLDYRSESEYGTISIVRLATVFSALAHCPGTADRVWRSRSRPIHCAICLRDGIVGFTHRRRSLSRRRRDYGGSNLSTN